VTDPRPPRYCFRTLAVALCYALVLQAFFAGFGNGLATGYASSAADGFTICHGSGGTTPPSGDSNAKFPCAFCALVAAGSGLLPDPVSAALAPLIGGGIARLTNAAAVVVTTHPRAGLSRAPPIFA
jgi:DUF2946 family protein